MSETDRNRQSYTEGQEKDDKGDLYYDERTMAKVHESLDLVGIPLLQRTEAITAMQNRGILFRERGKF